MLTDKMLRSSLVVFIFTFTASFLDYLYQVYVGRALGPSEYGVFASLFAMFYLLSIVANTIGTSVTRFVASGENLEHFLYPALKSFFKISLVSAVVFLAISPLLADFLRIKDVKFYIIIALLLIVTWELSVFSGTLRGLEEYFKLGVVRLSASFFKLIFGAFLIYLGYKSFGALLGVLLGSLISFSIATIYLRKFIKKANKKLKSLYAYSLPVFLGMLLLSLPTNLDLIIVRRLFPELSGIYASLTVLGKIVYFFPAAIYVVLFPMAVKGRRVLLKAVLYTFLLSGGVVLIYFLYPEVVVLLFSEKYMQALPYVFTYGLGVLFFSLSAVFLNYSLAIKNYGYIKLYMLSLTIYLAMIFANSIDDVVKIFSLGNLFLLFISLIYLKINPLKVKL